MTPHNTLIFDIETAPRLAYFWHPRDSWIPQDRVIHDTFMLSWAAKWQGQKRIRGDVLRPVEARGQEDFRIVQSLADELRKADMVVAHNLKGFDLPVVNTLLLRNGQEPLPPITLFDTLEKARRTFRFSHNNLDYLARVLGLDPKDHTEWSLWERAYHGDPKALAEMYRYNRQDVRVLEQVFDILLPHVKGAPRQVDAGSVDEPVCPTCGGRELERRGFYRTNASTFQKFQCKTPTCGRWSRARQSEKDARVRNVPL